MKERLQKLISAAGIASRRQAETMIREGRVCVNGIPAPLGASADPETDEITVDGAPLRISREKLYLMLNKPRGYVTTMSDEKGRHTVAELVRDVGQRVYPVGRLDMDSDGLLLLTNDGAMANGIIHPRHCVQKTYRTSVSGDLEAAIPVLRARMTLDDGASVKADRVVRSGDSTLDITIHEGRNRQVRRMCAVAGLQVRRLTRITEGPLSLGDLPQGQWRPLTKNEVSELKNSIIMAEAFDILAD